MPRKTRIPSYRLHKGSGQAVVVLNGKSVYLGVWDTPESRAEYARVIAEWLTNRKKPVMPQGLPGEQITVSELILAFWDHAERYYVHPDGQATGELDNYRDALRPVRTLYGKTPARQFGPNALKAVQQAMIDAGLARKTINARINRVRRMFSWAVAEEMIPVEILIALKTVQPLRRGRCQVRESKGVHPVAWADVDATIPHLPRPVAAMVQLMRFSNCRAEDAVVMRGCDIEMDSDLWVYRPHNHKNAWRGHARVIYLGPKAQDVLRPFLKPDPESHLFDPREAAEEHTAKQRAQRRTKPTPSQLARMRKRRPRRAPGNRYTVNTFQQAVRRACRRAGVTAWSVLQVRHTRGTEVRERFGVEGAAASLGNRRVETAQIYAEKNDRLSREIAREIG